MARVSIQTDGPLPKIIGGLAILLAPAVYLFVTKDVLAGIIGLAVGVALVRASQPVARVTWQPPNLTSEQKTRLLWVSKILACAGGVAFLTMARLFPHATSVKWNPINGFYVIEGGMNSHALTTYVGCIALALGVALPFRAKADQ